MKIQRSEASADISEFNLSEVGKEKVKLNDLLKPLSKNATQTTIKSQLKDATKNKTLEVPLSKSQAEKINRTVAYGKVSEEVGKWNSIVRSHRLADQIIFPLKKPDIHLATPEELSERVQSKNALEEEISQLLNGSENVLLQNKTLTVAEEKALKAMDLAEARKRIAELRKMRVLLSHQEARARRQKKIKSKKYHRLLKKERMKKLVKDYEELQKTDPAAAEEKLKEADKLRILERMTLKHRGNGKWAKHQKIRAKYNPESRDALREQKTLGRTLTEKVLPSTQTTTAIEDNDVEGDDNNVDDEDVEDGDLLNLYLTSSSIDADKIKSLKSSLKKKVTNKVSTVRFAVPEVNDKEKDNEEKDDEEEDSLVDETTERRTTLEDFDKIPELPQKKRRRAVKEVRETDKPIDSTAVEATKPAGYVSEIDFSAGAKILDSMVPDDITQGDEGVDDVDEDRMNIMQAFADDDLVSEFREAKKATVEEEAPGGLDLFLPGWGSWGGTDIKEDSKKRKRFYVKPDRKNVRKDSKMAHVIISEEKDKKAAVHQVSDNLFPFKSIDQFQSVIRQPIGSTWNTESSFRKMIAPKVVTKMGKIIDPMDADDKDIKLEADSAEIEKGNQRNRNNDKNRHKKPFRKPKGNFVKKSKK